MGASVCVSGPDKDYVALEAGVALPDDLRTNPGEWAVAAARKAASLEPSVASHRLALVQALWTASQEADARREVQNARVLASDDRERQSVQEWLELMDRARPRGGAGSVSLRKCC